MGFDWEGMMGDDAYENWAENGADISTLDDYAYAYRDGREPEEISGEHDWLVRERKRKNIYDKF